VSAYQYSSFRFVYRLTYWRLDNRERGAFNADATLDESTLHPGTHDDRLGRPVSRDLVRCRRDATRRVATTPYVQFVEWGAGVSLLVSGSEVHNRVHACVVLLTVVADMVLITERGLWRIIDFHASTASAAAWRIDVGAHTYGILFGIRYQSSFVSNESGPVSRTRVCCCSGVWCDVITMVSAL